MNDTKVTFGEVNVILPNIKELSHADWIKTGLRIQEELDRAGMTYERLAEYLTNVYYVTTSRQYISSICKGKSFPQLYTLRAMAHIFDCDTAYLLCEQDCRKHEATDIHAYTGLSETAIETLHALITETDEKKKAAAQHVIPFINQLLEDRAAVQRIGANLNEIAFATEYEKTFGGTGVPDKVAFRSRNGGMFDLSRTIEQQADSLLGNPYTTMDAGNRIPDINLPPR